jgi:1-acyl-sn-glycerol-3-phosphate acyltransferase
MKIAFWFMNTVAWLGTSILCRIDRAPLKQVPRRGPLILALNHINSLEVPLMFAILQPRKITGLAKIETWDSKFMGWLFDLWEAIPVRRGEVDMDAIHRCLDALKAGEILALAPEGTRSYDGRLQPGRPGISLIALHSGITILPMAHWGGEKFKENLKHWKRTDFHIRVGKAFRLNPGEERVTHEVRQAMVDEIMCQIAGLMPEEYHGVYKEKVNDPPKYLKFV